MQAFKNLWSGLIIRDERQKGKALADFSESLIFCYFMGRCPKPCKGDWSGIFPSGRRLRRRLNLGGAHTPKNPNCNKLRLLRKKFL